MDKIIEKDMIKEFNELLDKHIRKHHEFALTCQSMIQLADVLDMDDSEFVEDLNNHSSAIAGLMMVKMELNGEREY